MFILFFISCTFGQQIIPLIPNTGDEYTPWVGGYHPNGSIPVGITYWEVTLDDSKFQDWLFDDANDTGLNLKVLQTCEWNMTFDVRRVKSHGYEQYTLTMNDTNKQTVTYCDLHRATYRLMVENNGPQTCENVEMRVYIGLGEGICILEDAAKAILRIILICLFVCLGVCLLGCIAAVGCGVTACWCCCCKKEPQYYQTMNNYQPQPQYNQAYNQQNYPVQNNQAYVQQPQYSQPNYPVQNYAQPQQGYVQQPYSTAPQQPHAHQPNAMPYNPNPRSEHV